MDIAQKMLTAFNNDLDMHKKITTSHESWVEAMTLEPQPNHPYIEKSTTSSVKCKGFVHCFLRLQWRDTSLNLATRSYDQ